MKNFSKISGVVLVSMLVASPVFALDVSVSGSATATTGGTSVSTDARLQVRIANAKSHADQEIDRRVTALNDLNARVQAMTKLSSDQKATIATEVASQVSALNALKAKIDADTTIDVLKTDIQSITKSYRIFMLVIPQGRIEVAADKVKETADLFTQFSGKLQGRIADAQASGKDTAALSTSLADMNTKVTDASTKADAAVSLVASLTPDNGDQTKMQANDAAIKSARADIKAALEDLSAARKDAHSIVQGLHAIGLGASAGASSTATSNVH